MIIIKPISPVAINLFGLLIRWYAVAYILAFVIGFWLLRRLNAGRTKKYYDDMFIHLILGVIIGGRLGYVLFYNLPFFIMHPLEIFMVWHGGMSFHGGLLGVIAATFLFTKKHETIDKDALLMQKKLCFLPSCLRILDSLAIVAPIGLFFGRIANFINMELMGRETTGSLGVVFDGITTISRHPSPIYEAALEGVVLFIIMILLWRTKLRVRPGALSGMFAALYGIFRIFCEQFREPDAQLGYLLGTDWLTMGTILTGAMITAGTELITISWKSQTTIDCATDNDSQ
jgi:phosphatidylglycerol:prolipoprotein diacylglycerol transferase